MDISPRKVRCCHLFITYYNFSAFLVNSRDQIEIKKSQKLPISLKNNSQMQNICTCRYFFKINLMVSHIFDKYIFDHYVNTSDLMGSKDAPMCKYVVYKHSFLNKNFMMPMHCCIRYHLCLEQNIYITSIYVKSFI